MKEIKAYVNEDWLEEVLQALRLAGAPEITFARVELAGAAIRPEWVDVLPAKPVRHNPHLMKIEIVCEDDEAGRYAAVIRRFIGTDARHHIAMSNVSASD